MTKQIKDDIVFENCRIGFRNFQGKEGKFNPPGRRNFCVFIDDLAFADKLKEDGWNIRELAPRNDQEEPQPYMQVAVSYDNIPPKIVLVTANNKTILDESTIDMLDWAEIKNVDLVVRPYNWAVNGRSGVKAYCKTMYITIVEDVFAEKYGDDLLPGTSVSDDERPF